MVNCGRQNSDEKGILTYAVAGVNLHKARKRRLNWLERLKQTIKVGAGVIVFHSLLEYARIL